MLTEFPLALARYFGATVNYPPSPISASLASSRAQGSIMPWSSHLDAIPSSRLFKTMMRHHCLITYLNPPAPSPPLPLHSTHPASFRELPLGLKFYAVLAIQHHPTPSDTNTSPLLSLLFSKPRPNAILSGCAAGGVLAFQATCPGSYTRNGLRCAALMFGL